MAQEFTDSNFDEILQTDKVVMVDFWAEWCGPCKLIGPSVEELSQQYADTAVIGKLNVDHNPQTSFKFKVRNIPTVLFIKNGEIVAKQVGAVPKSVLEDKLKEAMTA